MAIFYIIILNFFKLNVSQNLWSAISGTYIVLNQNYPVLKSWCVFKRAASTQMHSTSGANFSVVHCIIAFITGYNKVKNQISSSFLVLIELLYRNAPFY